MRVVVTGGSGAVGRRLVGELRAGGDDVVVLGRTAAASEGVVATTYSTAALASHLADADAVVHLAWRRTPADSLEAFYPSISATENLIAAAATAGVHRLVLASSISVYSGTPPWLENGRPVPATSYGHSKLIGEDLMERAARRGLSTASLRIGHVYTDDEDNDYAVNRFIRMAEAGQPITVTGDSRRTRDMVYVADVCHAIRQTLSVATTGPVNIGSGAPVSMGTIARAAIEAFGGHSTLDDQESPASGDGSTAMDLDHAASTLGYAAEYDITHGMLDIAKRRGTKR
ncbi:SDR family oxidoreductase [Yimella radicis]